MRDGSTQPRVACSTPQSIRASSRVWWVSVLSTNVTSIPRARSSTSLDASSRPSDGVDLDRGVRGRPPSRSTASTSSSMPARRPILRPGEVRDRVDGRVLHRGEDAARLLVAAEVEVRVDAGHAPLEGAAELGVVVDAAVPRRC